MTTKHNLDFMVAPWKNPFNDRGWLLYRVGTVNGQWRCDGKRYQILSLLNDVPGNGHLDDVFEWFAGLAMQGMLSNPSIMGLGTPETLMDIGSQRH